MPDQTCGDPKLPAGGTLQAIAQLPELAKLLAAYEETDDSDDGLEGA